MTRKRFWGLRNAMYLKMMEYFKANGHPEFMNASRNLRPVSGVPLVNFGANGIPTSYKECWAMLEPTRKMVGME